MHEYVANISLRKHMYAVESAMRSYARKFGEDENKWGIVGLLHDFDYERWPDAPAHPVEGSKILRQLGYPEDVVYAILSHADYIVECPRVSLLDKALYACDELCGFIVACAHVRPTKLAGLEHKSVQKKLKNLNFAAAVSRGDIDRGSRELGVEMDTHIGFCIQALQEISDTLFPESENPI
jgi:putative nucleotidyltransferase with HDIG domain